MREMGFEYDPSTAGSSVRFDPPDKRDPVSFHMDTMTNHVYFLDSPLLSTSVRLVLLLLYAEFSKM